MSTWKSAGRMIEHDRCHNMLLLAVHLTKQIKGHLQDPLIEDVLTVGEIAQ